ncbi:lipoate--protein ligase [Mycoplasmoides alvi]|uniref:lipoate--protein ligase n=1 Tax=Mycoplasmoides alvi TaxID=78580 RepID=UPI00051C1C9A|nr:lipoate--protein ligase [Mycoplasmoides alvi]
MSWILTTDSTDPYVNAATEEYLLKKFDSHDELIIYLWRNDNTIVIGRNQNPLKEINLGLVQNDKVNLFRRFSGGGTVYHDLGNLNYTFIHKTSINQPNNYFKLVQPIINFLNSIGVKAEFKGRNDLEIDGKKISGNAQYLYQDKLLHHGTLLFQLNSNKLAKYLNVDLAKIEAKGIDSVRKRITNIYEHLPNKNEWSIDRFVKECTNWFIQKDQAKLIELDDEAKQFIFDRAKNHFATWEWNYGNIDESTFLNKKRFSSGTVEIYLKIKNGFIEDIKFIGDFLSIKDVSELQDQLKNHKYELSEVKEIFNSTNLSDYFGQISSLELLDLLFNNGK